MRIPQFFGLHARPSRRFALVLVLLPFLLFLGGYILSSEIRHNNNPDDKLLPSITKMVGAVQSIAFTKDKRTGNYLMLSDTLASLSRIGMGMTLSAVVGLLLGINMGLFPGMRTILLPFMTVVSIIPPLAILPIIFISFGVDEFAKLMIIFIGTFTLITRSIYLTVQKLPGEQITKALTLGASQLSVVYRVVLPQVMPRLIEAVRLSLGAAWLFLIAAEAIASTEGLGYRIFLVRRYLAMDIIIPYVLWITILGFVMDWCLRTVVTWKYPWYKAAED